MKVLIIIRRFFFRYLFIVSLLIVANSCVSPDDYPTPRRKTPIVGSIYFESTELSIQENGIKKDFNYSVELVGIDTTKYPNNFWFKMKIKSNDPTCFIDDRIKCDSIYICLDFLEFINNNKYSFDTYNPMQKSIIRFFKGANFYSDTMFVDYQNPNNSDIIFNFDKIHHSLSCSFQANLFANKLMEITTDTTYYDTTQYIKDGIPLIKIDTITSKTTKINSLPDSLKIIGTFIFKYE